MAKLNIPEASPLTPQQRSLLAQLDLNHDQAQWLSGYLASEVAAESAAERTELTVLFGTESGNSEALAAKAVELARRQGHTARLWNMADISPSKLAEASDLLVIVSTWGDGEPPDAAAEFHAGVMSDSAPRLKQLRYSVCALGDTSYERFCQTGKDFDQRFAELGAQRLCDRADCDVDYEKTFEQWLTQALQALGPAAHTGNPGSMAEVPAAEPFGKKNPFPSPLKSRVLLNGRGSAKETYHLEFGLEGSGLDYLPGDALALIPQNDPQMVEDVLKATGLQDTETVQTGDAEECSLREALSTRYDITSASTAFLRKYQELTQHPELAALLDPARKDELKDYLWGRQIIDFLEAFPSDRNFSAAEFTGILRKLPPRLYSIASSHKAHPGEVHLTVASVRYQAHGRKRKGVASTYIADQLQEGGTAPVYIHSNKNFRLPENEDTPIIMVGPGTGVAPFRAFIEERVATGAKGKNWLFFGDQHFLTDYLYQLEWLDYLKNGQLNRLDLAFSRDQKQKVYVQDKMREASRELYAWLEEGAHFYVCGDASRMAGDVHEALIDIVAKEGNHSFEYAEAYVSALKKGKRYHRDVY